MTDDTKIKIMRAFNKDKTDYDSNNFQTILALLKETNTEEENDAETEELSMRRFT